uniref:Uncharacterized protein n=1 Tax=Oryza sativa subsp. japonica TaxID=39947 RepID=Q6K3E7_ORYSJ|nr:hypothetical protein [Oryza sativa Japonica Group]BAD22393.1 hypothetical protein [Oryza sativa Japonica Group]
MELRSHRIYWPLYMLEMKWRGVRVRMRALSTCGTPTPAASAGQSLCAENRTTPTGNSSSHRGRLLHRRPRLSRQTD